MELDIGYNLIVNKGDVADYFEGHYLDYQKQHGRMTLTAFAEKLKFTRSYLSNLMEGKNKSMSYHTALYVSVVLNDFSLMKILGYELPEIKTQHAFALLSGGKDALINVLFEISESGSEFDSPESVALITSKLKESGFNVKTNSE